MISPIKLLGLLALISAFLTGCSTSQTQPMTAPNDKPVKHQSVSNTSVQVSKAQIRHEIILLLRSNQPLLGGFTPNETLQSAYQSRQFNPLWFRSDLTSSAIPMLLQHLTNAEQQGLNPEHYYVELLRQASNLKDLTNRQIAELDILATHALAQFAHDLAVGRHAPDEVDPNWKLSSNNEHWQYLLYLKFPENMLLQLERVAPQHADYVALQRWLTQYLNLAKSEGDKLVESGPPLRLGDESPRVEQVKVRLRQLGDLPNQDNGLSNWHFDKELQQAIVRFQNRHGLPVDGMAGPITIQAMNVPLRKRAQQIALNMERWRWLPSKLEPNRVWVDLTDYTAHIYMNGEQESMKVIIGKPEHMSRVFSGRMTYMVANPTWRVPQRIARENLLPKLQQNPNYLSENAFQIYSGWGKNDTKIDPLSIDWKALKPEDVKYRFEQVADPENALGAYKFMFPNQFDIYLHDTPAKSLFNQKTRTFSSGCIRLERASDFADLLVRMSSKKQTELSAARSNNSTTVISLDAEPMVYLVYMTVVPNANGLPEYRNDVYNRDPLMLRAGIASSL